MSAPEVDELPNIYVTVPAPALVVVVLPVEVALPIPAIDAAVVPLPSANRTSLPKSELFTSFVKVLLPCPIVEISLGIDPWNKSVTEDRAPPLPGLLAPVPAGGFVTSPTFCQ